MLKEKLELKVGEGDFEGKKYYYLYVELPINGEKMEIKLKPYSTLEKNLLVKYLEK